MTKRLFQSNLKLVWMILAAFSLFGALRLFGTFQSSVDIQRLYAELTGDYEFYFSQRYWIIRVTTDQGKLWGENPGESPKGELRPIDIAGLKFKIEDPSKEPGQEQYIVFVRSPEGRSGRTPSGRKRDLIHSKTEDIGRPEGAQGHHIERRSERRLEDCAN